MPEVPESPIYNEILDVLQEHKKQTDPDFEEYVYQSMMTRPELIRVANSALKRARRMRVHFDDEGSRVLPEEQ